MSGQHGAGKGSRYRKVDEKKYAKNWEQAFGKKTKKGKNKNERSKNSKTNNG